MFTHSVGVELFWVDLNGRHVSAPTPSVGVEHFWMDLGERHVFAPTPSVGVVLIFGGVYVIVILKA